MLLRTILLLLVEITHKLPVVEILHFKVATPIERELPLLGNDIPEPITVPGEMKLQKSLTINYDSFVAGEHHLVTMLIIIYKIV